MDAVGLPASLFLGWVGGLNFYQVPGDLSVPEMPWPLEQHHARPILGLKAKDGRENAHSHPVLGDAHQHSRVAVHPCKSRYPPLAQNGVDIDRTVMLQVQTMTHCCRQGGRGENTRIRNLIYSPKKPLKAPGNVTVVSAGVGLNPRSPIPNSSAVC